MEFQFWSWLTLTINPSQFVAFGIEHISYLTNISSLIVIYLKNHLFLFCDKILSMFLLRCFLFLSLQSIKIMFQINTEKIRIKRNNNNGFVLDDAEKETGTFHDFCQPQRRMCYSVC